MDRIAACFASGCNDSGDLRGVLNDGHHATTHTPARITAAISDHATNADAAISTV